MTQARYARHRNNSPRYIAKLAQAGILVMRGHLVDATASDAVLDDKSPGRTAPDGQPPSNYAQAKLADMVVRAKLRRLEFGTRQGKLIEAAVVKERWAAILVVLKGRVLAVPDSLFRWWSWEVSIARPESRIRTAAPWVLFESRTMIFPPANRRTENRGRLAVLIGDRLE